MFTRIYSPTRPAAVDVLYYYHYRTRYYSVEFNTWLYFRIINPLTEPTVPEKPDHYDDKGKLKPGWTRMFWLALDDNPTDCVFFASGTVYFAS